MHVKKEKGKKKLTTCFYNSNHATYDIENRGAETNNTWHAWPESMHGATGHTVPVEEAMTEGKSESSIIRLLWTPS